MRLRIDSSATTHVPICACGWRGMPAMTRLEALSQARHHEMRAHPGHHHARLYWRRAQRHADDS